MTDGLLTRIARPDAPLGDKVVSAVREAISAGDLVPGQRLIERELIESTGVSRTSIREALRHLQAIGLVERDPKGGLRVAVLDRAAIEHIYEVRLAIETAAAELFIRKASEDEFLELGDLATRLETVLMESARLADWHSYDELLIRGAHNPILAEMLAPLHTRIEGLRRLSMSMSGRSEASRKEILAIIYAVLDRDTKRAIAASRRHIVAAGKSALSAVDQA